MAVQSTARRAEAPQEATAAAVAKTVPEVEPAAAKPVRRPRAVAGTRSAGGDSSGTAGRAAGSGGVTRNRPASEANAKPRAAAARPAAAQPSQKDPEPQVTPEDSDPPQQVGRPSAPTGRPAAPAGGTPQQATPSAPIVQTKSAPRPGAAPGGRPAAGATPQKAATSDLTSDELRAYLSAVEAQVRAALRQVDAQSKEVQQAHTALRADLSAAFIHLQADNKDSVQQLEAKINRLIASAESGAGQNRLMRGIAFIAILALCALLGGLLVSTYMAP